MGNWRVKDRHYQAVDDSEFLHQDGEKLEGRCASGGREFQRRHRQSQHYRQRSFQEQHIGFRAVAVVRPAEPGAVVPVPATMERETWQAVQNDLAQFVGAAGLSQDVTIESTAGEILLSMRDGVPFDSGKADLRQQALPVLEKIAAVVLANPNMSVAVSGHTDSVRIANPAFPSNWELSTARASRVARYLVQRGLRPSRIAVQGYADQRPKNPNSTPTDRRANRRVEIRLFQESAAGARASAEK